MGLAEVDVAGAFVFYFSIMGVRIGLSWAAVSLACICHGSRTHPPSNFHGIPMDYKSWPAVQRYLGLPHVSCDWSPGTSTEPHFVFLRFHGVSMGSQRDSYRAHIGLLWDSQGTQNIIAFI